jgi:HTH-type transcriptional regulator/antitoxin HigA
MIESTTPFRPDYAAPPGWVLEEMLEAHEMSHAEFARRCGRSAKLVSEIISGKAPIEPETALQFERVLGMDARVWLNIESSYRLHRAREDEREVLAEEVEWSRQFPVNELVGRGAITRPRDELDCVRKLLAFFGVASVDAWTVRFAGASVSYRHSPSFESSTPALATWLRLGELKAEQQECAQYDRARFVAALRAIRELTTQKIEDFLPEMTALCNDAGVAFVVVQPMSKTALSGAARWLTPRKALIQQSVRHLSNDHFWFTFFHEAAHLLLHSRKSVFVDEKTKDGNAIEQEANGWAANFLVPKEEWDRFMASGPRSKGAVIEFAEEQGIAPGIVVGMLQHQGVLPWTHLNGLKHRYQWT